MYVALVQGGVEVARWPLAISGPPDVALVGRLARLQLTARRMGCSIVVCEPSPALADLLDLTGLAAILGSVEVGGEAEELEQRRVEEVVMPDDTIA